MPKAPDGYQPLLNRGSRGSLWLADDHLLVIETTRFVLSLRETYRRLDFTNIQAVIHTKSQRGAWLIVLISVILGSSLLILAIAGLDNGVAIFFATAIGVPGLIALIVHLIKGQTRSLIIQTTVRPWRLRMITRRSHALAVLAALEPLCRAAQQDISIALHTPDRPDTLTASASPVLPALLSDTPPPLQGVHPLAIPAWLCLLAFATMMGGEMIWNSMAATVLMLGFATAFFILLMIAFTRGGGTLAIGGRNVFIFALAMLGICLVAGYSAAMAGVFQSSIRGGNSDFSSQGLMLHTLAKFPEGSPDEFSIVAMVIIALTGISAVTGLIAAADRIKLQRRSMESPHPSFLMNPTSGPLQCAIHPQREAAARCSSCTGFFCRECVTEHDLRMLCARCLRDTAAADKPQKNRRNLIAPAALATQLALGAILLWISFYLMGRLLIAIPANFHEGTLWDALSP